ncbi:MAG: hypothetical protein LBE57_07720, partial [Methanosarcinales archaeon]|nr:hypothetical protein [Methanosarcinales archaeon]
MEDIIDTFGEGLKNLFKNPILFAPMGLLLLIAFISAFILGFALENVLTAVPSSESFLYISIIYLAYIAVLLILSSYLMAGLVGMSKEAVAFGKTNFSDMFKYGNKFALRLILASIILLILYLIAAIFWAPTVYVFMNAGYTIEGIFDVMINNPDAFLSIIKTLAAPALIGLLLTIIYTIVLTLFFYFVTYAIVVDDISVISAYKKSYAVLKQNFWKVLAFIILVWLLTIVFT